MMLITRLFTSSCFQFVFMACILLPVTMLQAQSIDTLPVYDYTEQQEYEIGGITVTGAEFSDENAITSISGLRVGDKIAIPGNAIPKAIKSLWDLRLFTNVEITQTKRIGDVIFLNITVAERPRLSRFSYEGVKKGKQDDLNEIVNKFLLKGGIVTDNVKVNAARGIEEFFVEKGYLDTEVAVREIPDESRINSVRLVFNVDVKDKVKIKNINFIGNENIKDKKLRKQMEETKEKRRLFASSKLIRPLYEADKDKIIQFYNTQGFRDARIVQDSIWRDEKGLVNIDLYVEEGERYYFRNIDWKGNSIYDDETLSQVLGIQKGDVYNEEELEMRLRFSQDGRDVSALYLDNGYLFFQVEPIEVAVKEDSIDLEMRIFEGPQATIDKVSIAGNDRTHEHVIRRELRTIPGQKFSRSDIIRSQREIINLGYFNPEALDIQTPVNPQRGTVDIAYGVEERPADQLELSAGWGGNRRVIGTLGVSFNNFSLRNIFNTKAWRPLPMGDGQRFSVRAQTNGDFFQSYNFSFTEPWLGGRKPNSLSVGGFLNRFAFGTRGTSTYQTFRLINASVSLGTRLKWPDDNFISSTAVNLQVLQLNNWAQGLFVTDEGQLVENGNFYNYSIKQTIARSSINDPIFPRSGSSVSLSGQFTPPYSLFAGEDRDFAKESAEDRFRFLEYYKIRFDAEWYTPVVGNLVLKARAKIGILGAYNQDIGIPPFERFQLGGDGINNQQFQFNGVDIISLRGYEVNELPSNVSQTGQNSATPIFDKFTVELRYPISLNPSSTIYVLAFAEGGNAWRSFEEFNPFDLRRSAGLGLRVFLPMFGTLGFDYGIGFDKPGAERTLQGLGDFNIILGFEPE